MNNFEDILLEEKLRAILCQEIYYKRKNRSTTQKEGKMISSHNKSNHLLFLTRTKMMKAKAANDTIAKASANSTFSSSHIPVETKNDNTILKKRHPTNQTIPHIRRNRKTNTIGKAQAKKIRKRHTKRTYIVIRPLFPEVGGLKEQC